jgi:drug/metabolite transporter (DMT)-like permease
MARSSLTFALLTLIASVGYSLFDKAGMSELGRAPWDTPVPRAIVYYVLLSLSGGLVFAPLALRRVPPRALAALARTELRSAVVAALVSFASYGLILQALVTAPVSYVVAARQSSVLFAIAIGVLRWRERPSRLRLAGALATVAGVALVAHSR